MSVIHENYELTDSEIGRSMGSILLSEDSFPSATSTSNTKRHSIHLHSSPCPSLPYPTSTSLTPDRIHHLRQSHNTLEPKVAVAGALISLLFSFGHMNAFGTYQAWYASHQLRHVPPFRISLIGSLQLWVFFLSVSSIESRHSATLQYVHGLIMLSLFS